MSFEHCIYLNAGQLTPRATLERLLSFVEHHPLDPIDEYREGYYHAFDESFLVSAYRKSEKSVALVRAEYGINVDTTVGFSLYRANYSENFRKMFRIAIATFKHFGGDVLFAADVDEFYLFRRGKDVYYNIHPDLWEADGPIVIDIPHIKVRHEINTPQPGM